MAGNDYVMVKKEKEEDKFRIELKNLNYHSTRFFSMLFSSLYIVAVTIFCIEYKIIPGPEFLVLGILIYAAYNDRTWNVFKDWLPFVTVFVSYEIMYSFIGIISQVQPPFRTTQFGYAVVWSSSHPYSSANR